MRDPDGNACEVYRSRTDLRQLKQPRFGLGQVVVDELLRRHASSLRLFVEHLAETGGLRDGLSEDKARDVVWAMNSPEFYRLFVVGRGWTGDEFESWLANAWQRLLPGDDWASPGARRAH